MYIFAYLVIPNLIIVKMATVTFDVHEFVGNPSVEELESSNPTKDQLKFIATNFGIQYSHDITKDQLRSLILAHLGMDSETRPQISTECADPSMLL